MRTLDMNYIKRTLHFHLGYGWSMNRNYQEQRKTALPKNKV